MKAVSFDYWDTLYVGAALPERVKLRSEAMRHCLLARVNVQPKEDCEYQADALEAVDNALLILPPPLIPGAYETLRTLARRVPLAIVSDAGFASGRAQDRLLEKDGVRVYFAATIYAMDGGHPRPWSEPFLTAIAAFEVEPHEIIHVGDNEHTDVRRALDVGMRAVRLDAMRSGGPSEAEFVARSFEELREYLAGA